MTITSMFFGIFIAGSRDDLEGGISGMSATNFADNWGQKFTDHK